MQQRYYDPIAGRFLSIDPLMTDADTGKSFGRYHYANNNPYVYVDPDGRAPAMGDCGYIKSLCEQHGGDYKSNSRFKSGVESVGQTLGGLAGFTVGIGLSGGCDFFTAGACSPANVAIVGGSIAGGALFGKQLGSVTADRLEKAWGQLDKLINAYTASGPKSEQYALVAIKSGLYPSVRGGTEWLNAGEVWKYGVSINGPGRYAASTLQGLGLRYETQAVGSASGMLVQEKIKLIAHYSEHFQLPPGNRIFK